jgi:hypothetical protein
MNFENILAEIEKVDPEVYDRLDTRRHAMQRFRSISGKIALAAIPGAIGAMFSKAYGQTASTPKDILKYALSLEYLEAAFYTRGVANAATIGITGAALTAMTKIRDDENAHVNFLKTAISAISGSTPADVASPNIDLTGGGSAAGNGPFAGAYQSGGYLLFLGLAQTFEDTGVRAYKGRAKELTRGGDYLEAALKIHSVEARHAAHIRYMRSTQGGATIPSGVTVKPWITQNQSGITVPSNTALDPVIATAYAGATSENTTVQAGVTITGIAGVNGNISSNAATEAFDEPLTTTEVLAIVAPRFIYP